MSLQKSSPINPNRDRIFVFLFSLSIVFIFLFRQLWDPWTIHVYLLLAILLFWLNPKKIPLSISISFLLFVLFFILSSIRSPFKESARLYSILLIGITLYSIILKQAQDPSKRLIQKVLCLSCSISSLFIVLMLHSLPSSIPFDEFFLKSNFASSIALLGFFNAVDLYSTDSKISIFSLLLNSIALIPTKSVSALIGLISAGSFLLYKKQRSLSLILFILLLIPTTGLIRPQSLSDRTRWWSAATEMVIQSPLLGSGAGSYERIAPNYWTRGNVESPFTHNFPLQMAAELGIPATLCFFLFFLSQFNKMRSRILQAGAIAIGVQNFFSYALNIPGFLLLYFLMISYSQTDLSTSIQEDIPSRKRIYWIGFSGFLTLIAWSWGFRPLFAWRENFIAEDSLEAGDLKATESHLKKSLRWDSLPAKTYSNLSWVQFSRWNHTSHENPTYLEALDLQKRALQKEPNSNLYSKRLEKILKNEK